MEDRMVPESNDTLDLADWYGWEDLGNSSANWTKESRGANQPWEKRILMLQIFAVIFYVIMMALGLVSNLLIIIPYFKNASLRRVTSNFFIVHMAVINMVNICIFYPLILQITFGGKALATTGNPTACLVQYVAFDMIFIDPSLFSVFCVSVNQCLLIASPHKLYRRCCTNKAIGVVLVFYWCCLFLKAGLQMVYRKVDAEKRCAVKGFENEWMSHVYWFLFFVLLVIPFLTIPVFHVTVLCYIRSSRKRTKGQSTRRNNTVQLELDDESNGRTEITDHKSSTIHKICVVSDISMVKSVSMAPVHEIDSEHDPNIASCSQQTASHFEVRVATDNRKNKMKDINEIINQHTVSGTCLKRDTVAEEEKEPEVKAVPLKRSLSRGLSRRFSSMNLTNRRTMNTRKTSRTAQGPGKAEIRLIKMMIAMYAILVTVGIASFASSVFVKDRLVSFILFSLGGLMPLYHTLVPYIYLWGNRNYHEAIKTLFGVSRICRSRVRPK